MYEKHFPDKKKKIEVLSMLCNIKSLTSRCLNDHDRWISVSQKHDRIGEVYRGYAKSTSNFVGGINRNFTTTWFSHVGCRRRIFEKENCHVFFFFRAIFRGTKLSFFVIL